MNETASPGHARPDFARPNSAWPDIAAAESGPPEPVPGDASGNDVAGRAAYGLADLQTLALSRRLSAMLHQQVEALEAEAKKNAQPGGAHVKCVGCMGLCSAGPLVEVVSQQHGQHHNEAGRHQPVPGRRPTKGKFILTEADLQGVEPFAL